MTRSNPWAVQEGEQSPEGIQKCLKETSRHQDVTVVFSGPSAAHGDPRRAENPQNPQQHFPPHIPLVSHCCSKYKSTGVKKKL